MGNAAESTPPPYADHPFLEGRRFDQGIPPEQVRQTRMLLHEAAQAIVGNKANPASAQRRQTRTHHLQMQAQDVRHVPWDVKRQDLPAAVAQHLVALCKTVEQHATLRGTVAFSYEILPGFEFAYVHR